MNSKDNVDTLVEDHREDSNQGLNLFKKILLVCVRAKDLKNSNELKPDEYNNPGYDALREFKQNKLSLILSDRTDEVSPAEGNDDYDE